MRRLIKKVFFLIFSLMFFASCGDDKKTDGVTPINLAHPDTLVGTYEIEAFWVNALITAITNNCEEAQKFVASEEFNKVNLGCGTDGDVVSSGRFIIRKDENGNYVAASKMQVAGGVFDNDTFMDPFGGYLEVNQYNYTRFTPVPPLAFGLHVVNSGANAVKGTVGRDLVAKTSDPSAVFTFVLQPDGKLLNTLSKTDPTDIVDKLGVYVLMRKVSNGYETLNPDLLFEFPAVEGFKPVPDEPVL